MLYHYDSRPYDIAASDAARRARDKLEALVNHGRERAAQVIETVHREQPEDRLVRGRALHFDAKDNALAVEAAGRSDSIHSHATQQVANRVSLPWTYGRHLLHADQQPWGPSLLAHNLNQLYQQTPPDTRFLLRSINGEIRGFLSDRFRRLDCRPIVESFADACQAIGALPIEGYITGTKVAIKAVLPEVFEPVAHEVMAFGLVLENSDFGNGALSLRSFCLRLWCTNFAITQQSIREVHLGTRLAEEICWSDKTHRLDTRRTASAVRDVVQNQLSADKIDAIQASIKAAHEDAIDARQALKQLRRSLTKGESEQVAEAFNGPDVELLPPGNSTWRLSNAISWVAGKITDAERRFELMKIAGGLII